jgi:hypothetical protein
MFTTRLQKASNFITFNDNKNMILNQLNKLNELQTNDLMVQRAKIECYKSLIILLYEISAPDGYFKCRKWYKYLYKKFINDVPLMIGVFKKVLEYNSGLKKKALNLLSFEIFKGNVSEMTTGGQLLSDLIRVNPETGEKYFIH